MPQQDLSAGTNNAVLLAELAARVTANATAELRLYKQGFNPVPGSVLADFDAEEADFSGYAAETVGPFSAGGIDADGGVVSYSGNAIFQRGVGAVDNTIAGAYMVQPGAPDVLAGYWAFTTVVAMVAVGATLQAVVALREPAVDTLSVNT